MHIRLKNQFVLPNSLWKPVVLCNSSPLLPKRQPPVLPAESLYYLCYLHMKYLYYYFTIFQYQAQSIDFVQWKMQILLFPHRHPSYIVSAPPFSWYNFVILVGSMLNIDITKNLYKPYSQLTQDIYYDLISPFWHNFQFSLELTIFCLLA